MNRPRKKKEKNVYVNPTSSNDPQFNYTKENIHNISFLCAVKTLYRIYSKLPKTMRILKEHSVRLNLLLSYGEAFTGYVGQNLKIDEVYTSPFLIQSEKILKNLNLIYNEPSIFLHENFSINLPEKICHLTFPCEVVRTQSNSSTPKIDRIFKLHSLPYSFKSLEDSDFNFKKEDVLIQRKTKLEALSDVQDRMEEYVLHNDILKKYHMRRLPKIIYSNIRYLFDCFQNNKLNECIVILRRNKKEKDWALLKDEDFIMRMKLLEVNIRKKIHENETDFFEKFTILLEY
jgi:hypothetical protein